MATLSLELINDYIQFVETTSTWNLNRDQTVLFKRIKNFEASKLLKVTEYLSDINNKLSAEIVEDIDDLIDLIIDFYKERDKLSDKELL